MTKELPIAKHYSKEEMAAWLKAYNDKFTKLTAFSTRRSLARKNNPAADYSLFNMALITLHAGGDKETHHSRLGIWWEIFSRDVPMRNLIRYLQNLGHVEYYSDLVKDQGYLEFVQKVKDTRKFLPEDDDGLW